MVVNAEDMLSKDFCLWGPPEPNSLIGNTEGEAVAWCTKPGRGTRLIPQGALTGVQFMKTPAYVQVRSIETCILPHANACTIGYRTHQAGPH